MENRIIIDNKLTHLDDEQELSTANCSVSATRWLAHTKVLLASKFNVAVRLEASEQAQILLNNVNVIKLITLDFTNFDDGRAYSQIKILRSLGGYKGEVRALNAHLDQLQLMLRCGIDTFELNAEYGNEDAQQYLQSYNVCYQQAQNNTGMKTKPAYDK